MKKWPFLASWAVLLAVCIVGGIVTRNSYVAAPVAVEELAPYQYRYTPYSSAEKSAEDMSFMFEESATELIASEPGCVAVTGIFTGNREFCTQCYLSDFQVESVLLGDSSLAGQTIRVYESVAFEVIPEGVGKLFGRTG